MRSHLINERASRACCMFCHMRMHARACVTVDSLAEYSCIYSNDSIRAAHTRYTTVHIQHAQRERRREPSVRLALSLSSFVKFPILAQEGGGKEELRTETIDTLQQVTTHTHHVACMPYGPHAVTPVDHTPEATAQHIRSSPCATGQRTTARVARAPPPRWGVPNQRVRFLRL